MQYRFCRKDMADFTIGDKGVQDKKTSSCPLKAINSFSRIMKDFLTAFAEIYNPGSIT